VTASNRGNANQLARLLAAEERRVSSAQRGLAGLYIFYLLHARVTDILGGHMPARDDLSDVAARAAAVFSAHP
jgi:hypothetical protein